MGLARLRAAQGTLVARRFVSLDSLVQQVATHVRPRSGVGEGKVFTRTPCRATTATPEGAAKERMLLGDVLST